MFLYNFFLYDYDYIGGLIGRSAPLQPTEMLKLSFSQSSKSSKL